MTSSKIRVLDEHTINKMAAGEVIESPASVVKELVENSLDAQATDICVEIKSGGRQLIRVTDNGCGMNPDDALLCLERHATSKIKEVEDIQSIFTMGFRGEAIPSIASISKFILLTCAQEGKGTLLIVEGGKIIQCGEAVRSQGTTIEVKSLFFNVPVRKKFQKSPAYDANEILKIITILSLGHPHVKFQMIDNEKSVLQTGMPIETDFKEQMKDRIATVLGAEFIKACSPLDIANEHYRLIGYVGLPFYARTNRTGQYLFINNRAVFSPLISYVAKEAYGTALPANKHPIFVIHLSLPGEAIDVNVHPQKKEVRLRQDPALKELLLRGIQKAIQQGGMPSQNQFHHFSDHIPEQTSAPPSFVKPIFSMELKDEIALRKDYTSFNLPSRELVQNIPQTSFLIPTPPIEKRPLPLVLNTIPSFIILDALSLERWKAVPQDGLCLLDQRAAHARVIFENLLKINASEIAVQTLLIPYSMNLNPHESGLLRDNLGLFFESGIHIHEIGPHSFMIDAIPETFGNVDVGQWIVDLLENLNEFQKGPPIEKEVQRRIALSAGYAAVNYNKRLLIDEARALVSRLFNCQTPFLCPQGKPTISYISSEEMLKKFQGKV